MVTNAADTNRVKRESLPRISLLGNLTAKAHMGKLRIAREMALGGVNAAAELNSR